MGTGSSNSWDSCGSENQPTSATIVYMDTEMRFGSVEFAQAFTTQISEEAKQRVWAYYVTRNTTNAIRLLGLKGSRGVFTERLGGIVRQLGAATKQELFGWRKPSTRKVDSVFLKQLIETQEYRCALSGVVLTPDEAELDHVVPFEQGGAHTKDNVQWVHRDINRMKSQMRQVEFVEWCRKVAAWQG